jgi:GAF domain-containing protein
MTAPDSPSSIAGAFDELGVLAFGQQPLSDVLARTAELTKRVLRVPVEASVTLIEPDEATTPAFTNQIAKDLDETQYAIGYGPCLAAAEAGHLVSIEDTSADTRWPQFVDDAANKGIRSTLSVPLPVQRQVIGALNLYATELGVFDPEVVALAEQFGDYAAVAIANTTLYMSAAQLAEQMQAAMTSRAVIEQAKGMLMVQRKCDADAAFDILVQLSQHSHRKLREVAQVVVDQALTG